MHVFREANLLDDKMRRRIKAHFVRAEEALASLATGDGSLEDLVIIPLIQRTRSLVTWARELRAQRDEIFASLKKYEAIANDFLVDKRVAVEDDGRLRVTQGADDKDVVALSHLSSGEKQILILLTAALLKSKTPVVYVADEPELSLHVSWQEKLLQSLVDLGGQIQIIVATHSPDIVGPFHSNVVQLIRTVEESSDGS